MGGLTRDDEFGRLVESARAVPMLEVLDLLDLDHPNMSGHIHSIFHDERTPSLHVGGPNQENLWYDFSTGKGGDSISFVQHYFGCSFLKAVKFLVQHADPELERRHTERRREPERIPELTGYFLSHCSPKHGGTGKGGHIGVDDVYEVKRWMEEKWPIDPDWAFDTYNLGVARTNERLELWAPHHHRGGMSGIKIRTLDGKKLAVPGSKFIDLYTRWPNAQTGFAVPKRAYIVEGESDTWSMEYTKPSGDVYGMPSGAAMRRLDWCGMLMQQYDVVYVCLDDDHAGRKATEWWLDHCKNSETMLVPGGRVAEAIADLGWIPT